MGDLAHDTEVQGGDGKYTIGLSRDWEIWGPNGGYIASIALRAAGAHSRFDRPASITGHYLGVASFDDPLDIEVTTLREAKRAESIRVALSQRGQPIFEALAWAVGDVEGLEHEFTEMPEAPDPTTLKSAADRLAANGIKPMFRFWENFDERPTSWIDDWENRAPTPPVAQGWYSYSPTPTFDDLWVDACRSLILIDTMGWPATCRYQVRNDAYIAPSIDIEVGFLRAQPAEPWLFVRAVAPTATGGLIACRADVWSRDGALLASGLSHLLCRPTPPQYQRPSG
jgi:acyl-CoA thioesterase-2